MINTPSEIIYSPVFKQGLFDRLSNSYTLVNNCCTFGLPAVFRKMNLRQLPSSNDEVRILDLMSGSGENWTELLALFPRAKITAIDLSGEMAALAKFKNKKNMSGKIEIIKGDLFEVPLKSNFFDIVICSFGLKCMDTSQSKQFASFIRRVLKPEGQFAMIETSKPENYFFRTVIKIQFKYLVPFIGSLFSKRPADYEMLWTYLHNFDHRQITKELIENGFDVTMKKPFFGCLITLTNFKSF